jgi:hypothetical protein
MGKDIAGTPRSMSVNGIGYRMAGDVNITEITSIFENSLVVTTGPAMRKMVKRIASREGVILITNAEELENLKSQVEGLDDLALSITDAAGNNAQCQGVMEIENHETEENRTTVQLLPKTDWTTFLA